MSQPRALKSYLFLLVLKANRIDWLNICVHIEPQ